MSFWTNPWAVAVGSGVLVLGVDRLWRRLRSEHARSEARVEKSVGNNVAVAGPIASLQVGDVHNLTAALPTAEQARAKVMYGARRMLDRVRNGSLALTSAGLGTTPDESKLDEVESAARDFEPLANDLFLLEPGDLRDRLGRLLVQVRREVAEVRADARRVHEMWDQAHDEHRSGRWEVADWMAQRRPGVIQATSSISMASHHKMRAWSEQAETLLSQMPDGRAE